VVRAPSKELPVQQFVSACGDAKFGRRRRMCPLGIEPRQKRIERLGRTAPAGATMHQGRVVAIWYNHVPSCDSPRNDGRWRWTCRKVSCSTSGASVRS
jgi:hypothetical protein